MEISLKLPCKNIFKMHNFTFLRLNGQCVSPLDTFCLKDNIPWEIKKEKHPTLFSNQLQRNTQWEGTILEVLSLQKSLSKVHKMLGLVHHSEKIPVSSVQHREFEWFSFYSFLWDSEPVKRSHGKRWKHL